MHEGITEKYDNLPHGNARCTWYITINCTI